jgi:hypothetical protein
LKLTSWQASVFFQLFGLLILMGYLVWYALEIYLPTKISEYLPHQFSVNVSDLALLVPFVFVWVAIIVFTVKRNRNALLASAAINLVALITVCLLYVTPAFMGSVVKPNFGDVVSDPILLLAAIFSLLAYHSFPIVSQQERNETALKNE